MGSEGKYNSTFIVNEIAPTLEIDKTEINLDIRLDNALKDQKVTLFTSNDCTICQEVKSILGENKF
ncbi:MAG: hypothetical protein QNK89_01880 [Lacinutrix sp.]